MNILVLNCGSSSVKYQVLDMRDPKQPLVKGVADRIGQKESFLSAQRVGGQAVRREVPLSDHRAALQAIFENLGEYAGGHATDAVQGVGHRVVHGA